MLFRSKSKRRVSGLEQRGTAKPLTDRIEKPTASPGLLIVIVNPEWAELGRRPSIVTAAAMCRSGIVAFGFSFALLETIRARAAMRPCDKATMHSPVAPPPL